MEFLEFVKLSHTLKYPSQLVQVPANLIVIFKIKIA
jgi:hypothetical protein